MGLHKSAISTCLASSTISPLGSYPLVSRLLNGIFPSCPPASGTLRPTWDVVEVLDSLTTWTLLQDLSLLDLSRPGHRATHITFSRSQSMVTPLLTYIDRTKDLRGPSTTALFISSMPPYCKVSPFMLGRWQAPTLLQAPSEPQRHLTWRSPELQGPPSLPGETEPGPHGA